GLQEIKEQSGAGLRAYIRRIFEQAKTVAHVDVGQVTIAAAVGVDETMADFKGGRRRVDAPNSPGLRPGGVVFARVCDHGPWRVPIRFQALWPVGWCRPSRRCSARK